MFTKHEGLDAILHRSKPSAWSKFFSHPVLFLARRIYFLHLNRHQSASVSEDESGKPKDPSRAQVTVVCVSDTHNCQPELPEGDILIHAGDLTQAGTLKEIQDTIDWLDSQPHRYKVVIAGNHDVTLDENHAGAKHVGNMEDIRWGEVIYLQNSSVAVRCSHGGELKIYGSPFSLRHGNWAFQYPRSRNIWAEHPIPADTDILITHGAPQGHLDLDGLGCKFLLEALWSLEKTPRLHVFGHVHAGHGVEKAPFDRVQKAYDSLAISGGGIRSLVCLCWAFVISILAPGRSQSTTFVNAAIVGGLRDEKRRSPIIVEL